MRRFLLTSWLSIAVLVPQLARAIEFVPSISIPGVATAGQKITITGSTFGEYIVGIYGTSVSVGAILSTIVLLVAGFVWLTAAGNVGQIETAKDIAGGAVSGLALLLLSWVLLNTINPNLVNFKTLEIQTISNAPLDSEAVQLGEAGPCNSGGSGIDPSTRSACVATGFNCNYAYDCSGYPQEANRNLELGETISDPAVGCCKPLGGAGAVCATKFDCLSGECINGTADFSRKYGICSTPPAGSPAPLPAH